MKSGSFATKTIMVLIFLAVAAYFGIQGYRYFVNPISTTLVYQYRTEQTVEMNGWFVRDEQAVDCSDTLVEVGRAEGERVAAGKSVATVYQSAEALNTTRELEALTEQLEQLKYAQTAAKDTATALRLDGDIERELLSLRATLAAGSYGTLASEVSALKTTVLKREFAYHGTSDLDERVAALESRIAGVKASIGGKTQTVRAPFAGTYSAVVDGYESVLRPDALAALTPAELDAVTPERTTATAGKLIRGSSWYYAAAIDAETAAQLRVGQALLLRAASGVDFDLPVTVQSVGRAQDGRSVIVLTGDEYLSYVTMLRAQSAELILRTYDGLRIPKLALRVGEDGQTGVYCRVGLLAYFKPVTLLYQGEDYCLVVPGEIKATSDSQVTLYTLRANDEVIISAGELFNGKVVG